MGISSRSHLGVIVSVFAVFAVLGGLLLSNTARASNSASASLTNVHIQLIKLDPTDGIAPGVSFFGNLSNGLVLMTRTDGAAWVQTYEAVPQGQAFGPWSQQVGGISVSSTALAGNLFNGVGPGFVVSSSVDEANAGGWAVGQFFNHTFTLTANTRLVVTGDVVATVGGALGTEAYARGNLKVGSLDYSVLESDSVQAAYYGSGTPFLPAPRSVQVSFENRTSASVNGFVDATASAYVTTPVPEPSTYALMLGGLVLLAARARRRAGSGSGLESEPLI